MIRSLLFVSLVASLVFCGVVSSAEEKNQSPPPPPPAKNANMVEYCKKYPDSIHCKASKVKKDVKSIMDDREKSLDEKAKVIED